MKVKIEDTINTLHNAVLWCLENLENEDWMTLDDPNYSWFGKTPDEWREWKLWSRVFNHQASGIFVFSNKVVKESIFTEFLLKFA